MSNSILILGESGTGKSSSIRNLPPEETFILNVVGKSLPFRGWKNKYVQLSPNGLEGNYYSSDDPVSISRIIRLINTKRLDIKYLIIDDFGYTIMNGYMKKAFETGYGKFTQLGVDAYRIFDLIKELRNDLFCVLMMHTEIDANGRYKPKTIGKMIDQSICIEGKFTYVFHSLIREGKYQFLTNNDGIHMAKSSMGMFEELFVDNDLMMITETILKYEE